MSSKTTRVVYWVSTLAFAIPLAWSAVQYLNEAPRMMATMSHLGYPLYFSKILGVAKLLGVLAIVSGVFPRLKEWAYAGFTFDVLGAFVSHLASGDPLYIAAVPLAFLAILMVSYASWQRSAADGVSPFSRRQGTTTRTSRRAAAL